MSFSEQTSEFASLDTSIIKNGITRRINKVKNILHKILEFKSKNKPNRFLVLKLLKYFTLAGTSKGELP